MNSKMRSCVMGLILGQFSSPLPEVQKEPVAYLYNGVRLPKLPEWDREKYPYAVIGDADGVTYFVAKTYDGNAFEGGIVVVRTDNSVVYTLSGNSWVEADFAGIVYAIWSNYDVYYNPTLETIGGTIFLAASDPIPVYE